MSIKIVTGTCLSVVPTINENTIDSVITDPPYGLKIKGNKWDYSIPSVMEFEAIRMVMKPGATILCFGGPRTFHRMMINMEDAGLNISDTIMWMHSQGWPKSVDISYMIDKSRGKLGTVKQKLKVGNPMDSTQPKRIATITEPSDKIAANWYGWNTGLKPVYEPIIVANKPIEGNYEDNALNHGVAGYWIDGCRVETGETHHGIERTAKGQWPANMIFDDQSITHIDKKISRIFFCAKPTKKEKKQYNNHDTVKPLDLMRYLCRLTRTPTGGVVLDPYCGSGTTGVAALLEGRDAILIDREKSSTSIAKLRISEYQ